MKPAPPAPPGDRVTAWRSAALPGVVLMKARFRRQHFARHTHRRYCLGVIQAGAMEFRYLGRDQVAPAGQVNLCVPGEPHDGHAAIPAGWAYRMFYLEPALVEAVAGQLAGRPWAAPFIRAGVLDDPGLAARLTHLHRRLEDPGCGALEAQGLLAEALGMFLGRHGQDPPGRQRLGREPLAVARARDYLAVHLADNVGLDELAREAGLSPYHLQRVFTRATGLSPHAWQTQGRVRRALELLAHGLPPSQAGLMVGFGDQAHFTRRMKALCGLTPGQYRKIVQDGDTPLL